MASTMTEGVVQDCAVAERSQVLDQVHVVWAGPIAFDESRRFARPMGGQVHLQVLAIVVLAVVQLVVGLKGLDALDQPVVPGPCSRRCTA